MNETTKNTLSTIFDVATPISDSTEMVPVTEVVSVVPAAPAASTPEESDAEKLAREDFEFSRGALKSVATESQSTLHRAVDVANQTDTPRSFEAVGDLVRATLEAHRELQSLHKTAAEIRLATKTAQTPTSQVNIDKGIVFSGSPDELLKLIDPTRR